MKVFCELEIPEIQKPQFSCIKQMGKYSVLYLVDVLVKKVPANE